MSKISGITKCHFIGVGGISMSALAKLMLLQGKIVSGSDLVYSKEVETLIDWGIDVWIGHSPEKIKDVDLVVYTAALPETDPELMFAKENGIPTVCRHHFIAELTKDFDTLIAVSGTHGKTTTTGMLAYIFDNCGQTFTAHPGGNIPKQGNLIYKGHKYFIVEACEYKKSMLALYPDIAVILNVEADHPDTYSKEGELYATFTELAERACQNGKTVINRDCHYYNTIKDTLSNLLTFGIGEDAEVMAENICEYKNGYFEFLISHNGQPKVNIRLNIPGYHNVYNALAAYSVAMLCGLDDICIKKGLESFCNIERRFEQKGRVNNAKVIIDYAHHPTEIKAAIATAKCLRPKRLIVVFQPHTYSRTKHLYEEFIKSFDGADKVYIFKEYPARETPNQGKSANDLYKGLRNTKTRCLYYSDIISLAKALRVEAMQDDIILILGAGDIALLGELIISKD